MMSDIAVTVTNPGAAAVTVSGGTTVSATVGNGGAVSVSTGAISAGDATVVSGTLELGSVTTLAAGSSATATNVGTAYHAIINLGIPRGDQGVQGIQGATGPAGPGNVLSIGTVTKGDSASATITGTSPTQTLNLVLPKGDPGPTGPEGPAANLSSATPAALGTAAAGSASTASRSDHVHSMPSYSDVGAAAASHSHDYVTSLNSLTGGLTLAAGSNVTITPSGSTLTIAASGGSGSLADGAAVDGGNYVGVQDPGIQISSQPQGGTGTSGAAFPLSITASYSSAISYQWQRRVTIQNGTTINSPQWAVITDRTTASVTFTETFVGTVEYRVVLSAAGTPSVTSSTATVTYSAPSATITITQQPQGGSVPWETDKTLSVTATSTATISYEWQSRSAYAGGWSTYAGPSTTLSQITVAGYPQGAGPDAVIWRVVLTAPGASTVTSEETQINYYTP